MKQLKNKDDSLYGVYDLENGDYDYLVAALSLYREVSNMKQLKRLIAVYEETIVVAGHSFRVEASRDIMKKNIDDSVYELYDLEKNDYRVASTIITYTGLYEIAKAYLTGDKQKLQEAIERWAI